MRYLKLVAALAATFLGAQAFAHTHLISATPADGAVLHAAPKTITLKFEDDVKITAVTVVGKDGKELKIAKLPQGATREALIVLPPLNVGAYTVNWRAAGIDGHVLTGHLKFTIAAV